MSSPRLSLLAALLTTCACGGASGTVGQPATPAAGSVTGTTATVTTPAASNPAPLADCGAAPAPYGASRHVIGVTLTGPATAVSGSVLHLRVHLRSLDGRRHVFEGGVGPALVLRQGRVVGQYEGALAASATQVIVRPATVPALDVTTLLAGCPRSPVDVAAPDLTRKALPPGRYDVVAVLPDTYGQLVTAPLRVQVTADPQALPSCGDVPTSTEPPQSRVAGQLTGPAQAKAGSTVAVQVLLRSNRGKPEQLDTGLPADFLLVRDGSVVGRSDGPVADVGLDLTVPAQGVIPLISAENQRNPLFAGKVTLSGCPRPSGRTTTVVSPSPRAPLPPGTYQLVGVLEDNLHGRPGTLVTQPLSVQVT